MPWVSLGTIALPDWEWHSFELMPPDEAATIFRVTHSWAIRPAEARAVICSRFANGERGIFRRSYPSEDASLIEMPVSGEYYRAALLPRRIQVKRNQWARVYADSNWAVTLEMFQPPPPDPNQPGDITDTLGIIQDLLMRGGDL